MVMIQRQENDSGETRVGEFIATSHCTCYLLFCLFQRLDLGTVERFWHIASHPIPSFDEASSQKEMLTIS